MKIVKALVLLVLAVWFGFIIHYNWEWLSRPEPIVSFVYEKANPALEQDTHTRDTSTAPTPIPPIVTMKYQTKIPMPLWVYLVAAFFLGAVLVAFAAFRDIYVTRRGRREARAALRDLKIRYDIRDESPKSGSSLSSDESES